MAATITAERILTDLEKLWASLADQQRAGGESQPVLRASAMTLIVLAEQSEDPAEIGGAIAEVMREHPNRAVLVRVREGAGPLLDYRVTAQCWMPFAGREQVCCEQVEISASDESLTGLMPILLAIVAPDLPLVVWCRSGRIFGLPRLSSLFDRADKLMVDSAWLGEPRDALAQVQSAHDRGRHIADLAWTRVTRWREVIAQVFEDPARRELAPSVREVTVLHARPAPPVTAYYLGAWVITCGACTNVNLRFEKVSPVGGGIEGVVLTTGTNRVSIRRAEGWAVLIEMDALKSCALVPRLRESELLARELEIPGRDPVFERCLPLAARRARE